MALDIIGLRAVLEGASKYLSDLDKIEKGEKRVGDEAETAAKKTQSMGKALTVMSTIGVTAFAGLGMMAIKFATGFEDQMDQVGAVLQANDADMAKLSATAKQLGADTAFSAGDAAKAMEELAAGGRSVAQIIGGEAKAAVDLAAAGNYDLANSARTIATTMDIWKDSTIDTTDVVNRLAGAANSSRFGVEDMSQAIASGGGVAAQAGVSFQDFSTVIAATASSFNSGSDAGTSFKTFITSLTGNSEKAKEMIAQLGLEFYNAQGQLKPMSEIVQQLNEKLSGLSQQQQTVALKTIFGNDAFRTAAGLMKMTGAEFQAMSDKMRDTDASSVAGQRMDNLSGSLEQLRGSLETLAIQVGERAIPILNTLAQGATILANGFGAMPASTQNMILGFSALVVALPALISGLERGAKFAMNIGDAFQTGRGKVAAFAAAIGLATVGLDILLQKTTGAGLMDRLFGDVSKSEAASEAMKNWNAQILAMGPNVDRISLAQTNLNKVTAQFAEDSGKAATSTSEFYKNIAEGKIDLDTWGDALLGSDRRLFGFNIGLSGAQDRSKELKEAIRQLGSEMVANNATLFQMQQAYDKLPPELQKVFDETTNVVAATAAYSREAQIGSDRIENYVKNGMIPMTRTYEELAGVGLPDARTALEIWNDEVEAGTKDAKDFNKELDALAGRFKTLNPQVIEAEGKLAAIDEELADLNRSGGEWSETLGKTKKQLEDEKKALEDLVKAAGENETATKGMRDELMLYIGQGLINVQDAIQSTVDDYEKQIEVEQKVAEGLRALSKGDIPAFVKALETITTEAPEVATAVLDNLGPGLQSKLEANIPALQASASKIANAIADGLIIAMEMRSGDVSGTARDMINRAMGEIRVGAQTQSPSKLTLQVGHDIAEGLAIGMKEGSIDSTSAAADMIRQVIERTRTAETFTEIENVGLMLSEALSQGILDGSFQVGSTAVAIIEDAGDLAKKAAKEAFDDWIDILTKGVGGDTAIPWAMRPGAENPGNSTIPDAPAGAYGQDLVWDEQAKAWVYPGMQGQFGNAAWQANYNAVQQGRMRLGADRTMTAWSATDLARGMRVSPASERVAVPGGGGTTGAVQASPITIDLRGATFGDNRAGAESMIGNAVRDALRDVSGRDAYVSGVKA